MIDDSNLHLVGEATLRQPHPAARRLVTQRIRQQVDDNSLQQGWVGDHLGNVRTQVDLDVGRPQGQLVQRRHDDLSRVYRHHRDPQHPRLQPGDVEKVGDQIRQLRQRLISGFQQIGTILVRKLRPLAAQPRHSGGGSRQRAAQVVTDR